MFLSLPNGVVIVLTTFIEDPPSGLCNVLGKRTDITDSHVDLTRSTLDGTAAPQGSGAVHSDTPAPEDHDTNLIGLLRATGQGNQEAFTEFYGRTSPRVFGLARRVVLDPGLAEEVAQEVFIVVWRDAATYDPAKGSPTTWLLTIAHRKAVDKVRSHQSSNTRNARWAAASWTRPYDEVAASLMDRTEVLELTDSLAALSPLQREAIVLAYFGSLTYREVAERLSKPLPTIKSRIRDGLNQLREHLGPV